jgi:hypothetical protein
MKSNRDHDESINDFSYCDCHCICEESSDQDCLCLCDCHCLTVKLIIGNQFKKFKTAVPHIPIKLPRKAGTKKIPINIPITVKVPRSHICHSLPDGPHQKIICEPEIMNPSTVMQGVINVCVVILPGAQVGKIGTPTIPPARVKLEIEAANQIWKQNISGIWQGVTFHVRCIHVMNPSLAGLNGNVEDFPWKIEKPEELLFNKGKQIYPNADVYIFYMDGEHIGPVLPNGARTDAITFRNVPVIIMSNGAQVNKYILAHELGHFMYLNNLMEYPFDPFPFPLDHDHNANSSNLMFPTSDYWAKQSKAPNLTPAQIRKALNTRFFYEKEK